MNAPFRDVVDVDAKVLGVVLGHSPFEQRVELRPIRADRHAFEAAAGREGRSFRVRPIARSSGTGFEATGHRGPGPAAPARGRRPRRGRGTDRILRRPRTCRPGRARTTPGRDRSRSGSRAWRVAPHADDARGGTLNEKSGNGCAALPVADDSPRDATVRIAEDDGLQHTRDRRHRPTGDRSGRRRAGSRPSWRARRNRCRPAPTRFRRRRAPCSRTPEPAARRRYGPLAGPRHAVGRGGRALGRGEERPRCRRAGPVRGGRQDAAGDEAGLPGSTDGERADSACGDESADRSVTHEEHARDRTTRTATRPRWCRASNRRARSCPARIRT